MLLFTKFLQKYQKKMYFFTKKIKIDFLIFVFYDGTSRSFFVFFNGRGDRLFANAHPQGAVSHLLDITSLHSVRTCFACSSHIAPDTKKDGMKPSFLMVGVT